MAKKSIAKKRKKHNRKKWVVTPQAPLCALGEVLRVREVFQPLHDAVDIRQKTVVYSPADKLVFVVLGMLSGAETVSEIQTKVRPGSWFVRSLWLPKMCGCVCDPANLRCLNRSDCSLA